MYPNVSLQALWDRLGRLQNGLTERMKEMASKPREWWLKLVPYPRVNIREEVDAFYIEAEVPGVPEDQLDVFIREGNELVLQGERKPVSGESGAWHYRECGEGRFQRVLTLPAPVDAGKVQARLEQGVLRLVLPKTESAKPHRVPVQGADNQTC